MTDKTTQTLSDQKSFWQAAQTASDQFTITAPPIACVGPDTHQFFMGGVGMASLIDALERRFDKPLLWATTHFLNHAMLGDTLHIETEQVSGGRSVVQAMAVMQRGDTVIQRLVAALGKRDGEPDRQFAQMPNVAPPAECPLKVDDAFAQASNLLAQFERRTAYEDNKAGVEHMWIRCKFPGKFTAPIDAALLALISDFFLGAHERSRGGTSLDNTFRLCAIKQTEWILCTTQIASFTNGAMQGTQYQFAEDGTLLSLSSQTGLLPHRSNQ